MTEEDYDRKRTAKLKDSLSLSGCATYTQTAQTWLTEYRRQGRRQLFDLF